MSQLPRGMLDFLIILILTYSVIDDANVYSLGIAGMRMFISFNNIINQIPLILHGHPYLEPSLTKENE